MATRQVPTEDDVLGYMTSLSNWGRWGPDDQRGTLNLITPEKRAQAGALVREGITVSCSRPLTTERAPDVEPGPLLHYMSSTGEGAPTEGEWITHDFMGISPHGLTITHLDSLCHYLWNGKMYNGRPSTAVTAQNKAIAGGIENADKGFVTRGVLLDIADHQGRNWLDADEAIFPENLDAAEQAQGVRVEPGDALLIRTGWYKRRVELGPPQPPDRPGLHAATLPWLRERDVSIIAADAAQDVVPSGYPRLSRPVHIVGIVGMGLWMIDGTDFEELAETCKRLGRWEFMFIVAPLRFPGATASPVNPLAVF